MAAPARARAGRVAGAGRDDGARAKPGRRGWGGDGAARVGGGGALRGRRGSAAGRRHDGGGVARNVGGAGRRRGGGAVRRQDGGSVSMRVCVSSVWRACVCVEGTGISPEPPTSPSAASALPSAPDLALGKAL